jgi:threonylcarbamoyladenosine tRNA methylthiotransferase MtaB
VEIDDRLFALLTQETRVMPHVHLSLQSGDDMILKRMKRRHTSAQATDLVDRLKTARPDIAIGADIIAGFPTEDDAMFANSLNIIDACGIVHGHIFPYSPKAGTPAARMPQVAFAIIKARAKSLRDKVAERRDAWLSAQIGATKSILVEKSGRNGHAEDFALVELDSDEQPGAIITADITAAQNDRLLGTIRP